MDCLFLYNPNSGKGKLGKKLPYIREKLSEKYENVEIVAPRSAEELKERVKSAACDVIFSGGDGTFHDVVQAAEGKTLGYLPAGTVNDVARSLFLPRNTKKALDVILHGVPTGIDCMRAGEGFAVYVAAAGAFTASTYATPQAQKRLLGPLAYALYGLKHGLPLKVFPVRISCDGVVTETNSVLVLVLNGRSAAGFPLNKRGSMRDGMLEVALIRQVKKPNALHRLGALLSIGAIFLFGVRFKKKDVLFLRGKSIEIETDPSVVWDLDGEKGPCGGIKVSVAKDSFRLYLPSATCSVET